MEIYDTEEEQVEALKRWWKENGTSTIAGIVIALAAIGGWNYWQSYQKDQALQASALFDQLLKSSQLEQHENVAKISQQLTENYSSTAYADLAKLFYAKDLVQQEKLDDAKTALQALMATGDNELKNLARIRLVRLLLATKEYEKGLQVIAEADASTSDGFSGIYDELTGDLYVALGRLAEARTAYKSALRSGLNSPLLQFKMDDITAAEVIDVQIK